MPSARPFVGVKKALGYRARHQLCSMVALGAVGVWLEVASRVLSGEWGARRHSLPTEAPLMGEASPAAGYPCSLPLGVSPCCLVVHTSSFYIGW
mgnify:CR=1 FL=1